MRPTSLFSRAKYDRVGLGRQLRGKSRGGFDRLSDSAANKLPRGTGRRRHTGTETLIVQNRCGWEGHNANLRCQIDPQVFGLYGLAKADAQTTLPAKDPANIKSIQLLREAYNSL